MNSKFLVGGLLGGIAYFVVGGLLYGMLLADTMASYMMPGINKANEEMDMVHLILGNLGFGFLLSFVFSKWSSPMSLGAGATGGAIVGLLVSLSYNLIVFATSNIANSVTWIFVDAVVFTVISGVAGAVVGWWMGRK